MVEEEAAVLGAAIVVEAGVVVEEVTDVDVDEAASVELAEEDCTDVVLVYVVLVETAEEV